MTKLLSVRGVTKAFGSGDRPAVDQVSLECQKGEILALVGGSGSGKTTLLRIIAGLEIPDAGEIDLNGAVTNAPNAFLPPEKRDCTLVFQDYALFPNMTVEQNVFFSKASKQRKLEVDKLLEQTQIAGSGNVPPSTPRVANNSGSPSYGLSQPSLPSCFLTNP